MGGGSGWEGEREWMGRERELHGKEGDACLVSE